MAGVLVPTRDTAASCWRGEEKRGVGRKLRAEGKEHGPVVTSGAQGRRRSCGKRACEDRASAP